MPLFGRRKRAPQPVTQPSGVLRSWQPQALPVGEVPPADTLASLAAAARGRYSDPWAGHHDTDRAWRA